MAQFRARCAKLFLTIAATAAIAACGGGGGGGDDGESVDTSSAQGVYEGQLGANTTGQYAAIVLENGESWALYSFTSASGFLHARGTSSNGSYSANDVLDYGTAPPAAGSVQASYNASAGTLQGQYVFGTLTVPFSASRPAQGYQYNTPADPSTITGSWSFVSSADQSMQLQVAADGSLTASGATGCTMTGSLTPRPSGKNVFNAALRFGSACAQPGLVAAGVAIVIVENGERALIVMGASSDRTIGTVAVGTRAPI